MKIDTNAATGGGSAGGSVVSATAPEDTNVLWVDTANSNLLKFYDGSAWIPVVGAWAE